MTSLMLATLVTFAADAEPLSVPKGAPPTLVFMKAVDGRVTMAQLVAVPVTKQVKIKKNVGGREVEETTTVFVMELATREVEMSLDKATFSSASGKKLTAEEVKKRLAGGAMVALSSDGKAVDKNYLSALKSDIVVIVLPPAVGTDPVPVPLPAPGGVRPLPAPIRPLPVPEVQPLPVPVPAPDRR